MVCMLLSSLETRAQILKYRVAIQAHLRSPVSCRKPAQPCSPSTSDAAHRGQGPYRAQFKVDAKDRGAVCVLSAPRCVESPQRGWRAALTLADDAVGTPLLLSRVLLHLPTSSPPYSPRQTRPPAPGARAWSLTYTPGFLLPHCHKPSVMKEATYVRVVGLPRGPVPPAPRGCLSPHLRAGPAPQIKGR